MSTGLGFIFKENSRNGLKWQRVTERETEISVVKYVNTVKQTHI